MRMKVFDKRIIFFAIVLITVIAACVKTTSISPVTTGTSIAGIIKAANHLTLLDSAMSKAGLLPTLDSLNPVSVAGPYTLFAPLDIAFANAAFTDSTIYKYSKDSLKRLLTYHLISGQAKYLATFPQGPNAPVPSASGDILYITVNSGNLFVNGSLVTSSDVTAKNGVIQVLSGLLLPPIYGNTYKTLDSLSLKSDTTLTFLVAALNRASTSSLYSDLDSLLANKDSVFTILAPTNSAFAALGDTTIAVIDSLNPDTLAKILQCHILNGRVFTSDIPQSGSLTSIAGDSLAFSALGNLTVLSKGDSSAPANIISVNRVATNGVIHKIDKILLP